MASLCLIFQCLEADGVISPHTAWWYRLPAVSSLNHDSRLSCCAFKQPFLWFWKSSLYRTSHIMLCNPVWTSALWTCFGTTFSSSEGEPPTSYLYLWWFLLCLPLPLPTIKRLTYGLWKPRFLLDPLPFIMLICIIQLLVWSKLVWDPSGSPETSDLLVNVATNFSCHSDNCSNFRLHSTES